jgi:signal transduction histidine kinase
VEAVTRASERLSEGRWSVEAPVRGGAEVARLGVSFNEMARQLRKERLALEQRLHELENTTAELASAQDQVVRSARLASVGRLSAGVAHEIGNPLSAILGLLEIVQGGELDEAEQREFLSRIQAETERIQKIIRDLLDFARQGSSEHEQQDAERTCDVREVVEDAVRLVAPQKDLRGVTIERRFADDAPWVRAVPDRLTQVVLNLLLNAADAIEGDGAIYVEVYRTGGEERPELLLAVEDTGPGIDPEVLEHLFEPFVTTKPTGYGTGLGLAVCYTIVERLGGSMHACNAERGGARFEIRLPAAEGAGEGGDG